MATVKLAPDKIRLAWESGSLGYRLRNIQKKIRQEWIKAAAKFLKFYIECTRRLGKSTYGILWLSEDCIKNPGCINAFFAPVKEGIKDYIGDFDKVDTPIGEAFKDCPEDLRPVLDAGLSLTFPNGSKIIFRGSNNKQHRVRRGGAFRRVFIDEARDVDDLDNLVDSVVIPSLFSTFGRLLISSTPADTEDHPLHAIMQAAQKEGWYFKATIYDAGRYDPEDFSPARIALFKSETKDPIAWQREFLAMWVKDPTKTVIPEWDDKYIQPAQRDECFQFYHKYDALDSGVTDKTAGILAYYDFKRAVLFVEDEFTLQDSEVRTDRIANEFKERERRLEYQLIHDKKDPRYRDLNQHQKVFRRVADNNNLILVNDLNSLYSLDFFPTGKDELVAMINLCREFVKDGRIIVDSRCVELIGCLRNGIWDKKREKLAKSKIFGHFDALMALVYLVRNIDIHSNPIPKFFGKSWATHAGVPMNASDTTRSVDILAKAFNVQNSRQQARSNFVKGGG